MLNVGLQVYLIYPDIEIANAVITEQLWKKEVTQFKFKFQKKFKICLLISVCNQNIYLLCINYN